MKSGKIGNFLSVLAIFLLLFSYPLAISADEVIEIKANAFHPMGHTINEEGFKWYGKEIEKRTNGKVKFTWFLGQTLVTMSKTYDALKSGICDWAYIIPAWNPNEFVMTNAMNLPFTALNSAHASAILRQVDKEFPELKAEYKKVQPLFFFSTASIHVHTNKKSFQPKTIEDLSGLRLGSPGPKHAAYLNMIGAAAQQIESGDLYTAMQRGMIDGVIHPDASLKSQKLTDLCDYHMMMSLGIDVFTVAMNKNSWKKLPPDVQKVILEMNDSSSALFSAVINNEADWVNGELKKRGDIFYYLPDDEKDRMRGKLKPVYDEWLEKAKDRGLDGPKILKRVREISDETRNQPYKPDAWWGNAGRKD